MMERDLLETYRASGSEDAFSEIVKRHSGMVYGICLRMLKNPAEAEDAMQATFIVLTRKIHGLRRGTVLAGWLYRTARHVALHARDKAIRRAQREREAAMVKSQPETASARWQQIAPCLDEALGSLPQAQQDVIALRFLEGLSEAEVARTLGAPRGTVSARLTRGLAKLRSLLARRGCVVAAPVLAAFLTAESAHAAPAGAVAGLIGTTGVAASGTAQVLAGSVLKTLFWAKVKFLVTAALAAAGLIAFVSVAVNWLAHTAPVMPNAVAADPTPASHAVLERISTAPSAHGGTIPSARRDAPKLKEIMIKAQVSFTALCGAWAREDLHAVDRLADDLNDTIQRDVLFAFEEERLRMQIQPKGEMDEATADALRKLDVIAGEVEVVFGKDEGMRLFAEIVALSDEIHDRARRGQPDGIPDLLAKLGKAWAVAWKQAGEGATGAEF